jgi:hypothetical protein
MRLVVTVDRLVLRGVVADLPPKPSDRPELAREGPPMARCCIITICCCARVCCIICIWS